jgi:phosphoglycolate phosphatase
VIKVVIIDLDDTLVLTEEITFHLENDVLQLMGRPPMTRARHRATWGRSLWDALPDRSPGADIAEFRRIYAPVMVEYAKSGRIDTISPKSYEALLELKQLNKKVLILTSRSHEELAHLLAPNHQLAEHVLKFYYQDTMQFHKPDPRAFSEVLQDYSVKPQEAVYIGDSISDAQTCQAAGLHFIASLESGLRNKQDFSDYNVDAFITSFPEVASAVKELKDQED